MGLLTSRPWWMVSYHHHHTLRHAAWLHVQTGAVETHLYLNESYFSLWEHSKSLQTSPAAATVSERLQADTKLLHYLEEAHIDANADSLSWWRHNQGRSPPFYNVAALDHGKGNSVTATALC